MNIEIKKSIKPVNYFEAIDILESRLKNITAYKEKELIWKRQTEVEKLLIMVRVN